MFNFLYKPIKGYLHGCPPYQIIGYSNEINWDIIKSIIFYFMSATAVLISIYDISMTVKVGTEINELNPLVKYIIMYGTKNVTNDGLAWLIAIKSLILCIISMCTPIYHYSKNLMLNKIMYIVYTMFFVEHLFVLFVLLK